MDKPIRVLHYGSIIDTGGIKAFFMNLYREIDRTRVQFDVVQHTAPNGYHNIEAAKEVEALGGRIHIIPQFRQHPVKAKRMLEDIILNSGIDILHCEVTALPQIYAEKIACAAGIPTIVHSHSAGRHFGESFLKNLLKGDLNAAADNITFYTYKMNRKKIIKLPCHFFACSKAAGIDMFGEQAFNEGRVTVFPNAINAEKFIYSSEKAKKNKLDLGIDGRFVIGHVGRFEYEKNHVFLIEIFNHIKQINRDAVLLLVGNGITRPEVETRVEQLKLKDSVLFLGAREDIPDLLQAVDVFVLPSHYEGLPISLLEAQATGLHCIASDAVTAEINIAGLCEFISLGKPADYWADQILKYSAGYMRENTREAIVNAGYDITAAANEITEFYCSLVTK